MGGFLLEWDPHSFLLCFLTTATLQLVVFVIVRAFKFRAVKLTFPVVFLDIAILSLLTYVRGGANHSRKALVTFLTVAYSTRLAGFLVFRSLNIRGKERGENEKMSVSSLVMFCSVPVLFALPVIFCNSPLAPGGSLGLIEIFGTTTVVLGVVIESVADYQKFRFRQDPRNKGKWCGVGLFKYSRYPNYFGDLCAWWGIFLLSVPTLAGLKWVAVLSPLLETCVILKWDGVPKLEAEHEKRYGNNPEYVLYKKSTSTIIPCPTWL